MFISNFKAEIIEKIIIFCLEINANFSIYINKTFSRIKKLLLVFLILL